MKELFGMRDDTRRDRLFWGAAALALGLFIWVYSHAASGEGDFADAPPSLAPSAVTQAPSPAPLPETQAPTSQPASLRPSPASGVILPLTVGREFAAEPTSPPLTSGSSPSAGTASPKPTPKPSPSP